MDGLEVVQREDCSYVVVSNFSTELKEALKNYLVEICYGKVGVTSAGGLYSFENTLRELLHRYPSSDTKKQIGFIGELLVHLIIRITSCGLDVVSPFFNMEVPDSAKRGFDIILFNYSDNILYFLESKSGLVANSTTAIATSKIHEAKRDLIARLNENKQSLWSNAYNNVRISLSDIVDEKAAVVALLNKVHDTNTSQDKNVILSGSIFGQISNKVDEDKILAVKKDIVDSGTFSSVRAIVIHKETYQKIYEFLESLNNGSDDEKAKS